MLDKSKNEKYYEYERQLERDKFTGKVTTQWFKGGISKLYRRFEPIIEVEEQVILKR